MLEKRIYVVKKPPFCLKVLFFFIYLFFIAEKLHSICVHKWQLHIVIQISLLIYFAYSLRISNCEIKNILCLFCNKLKSCIF